MQCAILLWGFGMPCGQKNLNRIPIALTYAVMLTYAVIKTQKRYFMSWLISEVSAKSFAISARILSSAMNCSCRVVSSKRSEQKYTPILNIGG